MKAVEAHIIAVGAFPNRDEKELSEVLELIHTEAGKGKFEISFFDNKYRPSEYVQNRLIELGYKLIRSCSPRMRLIIAW